MLPGSPDGRDLAPRLAAALDRPLLAGATTVTPAVVYVARGGGLELHQIRPEGPFVATLQPGVRGTEPFPGEPAVTDLMVTDDVTTVSPDATVVDVLPPDVRTMDLAEARHIVGGGAGLDSAERFGQLAEFARAHRWRDGGHPRRSPTAAGSATIVRSGPPASSSTPRLYVSFGVSGAVQHTSGLGAPEHIISVNTEPHCPMMAMSDLAIVSDANETLDHLIALVAGRAAAAPADHEPGGRAMSVDVDVVVVGAGPAGSCAATVLARAGHSVVLSSAERSPERRTCTAAWCTRASSTNSTPSGGTRRRCNGGSPVVPR